jgi:pyrroline-5-carboxylate reductase
MRLGIIGCGNMGTAVLRGMLKSKIFPASQIYLNDLKLNKVRGICRRYKTRLADNLTIAKHCQVIILAVKPKDLAQVLEEIRPSAHKQIFISLCAGISTRFIEKKIGAKVCVIRSMPNLAAKIQQAVTAICPGRFAKRKDLILAEKIFSSLGSVVIVKEKWMNAVTALSASGLAYFFFLMETLLAEAKKQGIEKKIAQDLIFKTALGSALLVCLTRENPELLRQAVTSNGGTTEAAFKVFAQRNLAAILHTGFKAAIKRARQLEK